MFDLHRLRLLRELKHRGTLAAVATALSYSPSAVSQQLSQLETEVGVLLLEPVGRRVRLTQQAEILVAHTEAVLERLERAEADIATSLTDLTGTLRIAAFHTAALALVPPALTSLRASHPRLRVHVTQMEPERALPGLLARDFDLVIAEEYPGNPNPRPDEMEQEELCHDPLRLAHPHRAGTGGAADATDAAGPTARLRALADHPWVGRGGTRPSGPAGGPSGRRSVRQGRRGVAERRRRTAEPTRPGEQGDRRRPWCPALRGRGPQCAMLSISSRAPWRSRATATDVPRVSGVSGPAHSCALRTVLPSGVKTQARRESSPRRSVLA